MSSVLESLFFAVGEDGLSIEELESILEIDEKKLNEELDILKKLYEKEDRGITLKLLGNKYKLVTKAQNKEYIKKLTEEVSNTLSKSALETLAIIAYNEPITRIAVDEIRGVKSESAITRLVERGLIKDVGRLEVPGRPILYGTTDEFLRQFGLKTIKELPSLDLYSDEETQSSIDLLNKAIEDMEPEVDDFENNDNENNIENIPKNSDLGKVLTMFPF